MSLINALANPVAANPQNFLTGLQGLTALRDFQARNAMAGIYGQAINPSTGQLDMPTYNRLLQANQQALWNAGPEMQQAGQSAAAQAGGGLDQLRLQQQRYNAIAGFMTPLYQQAMRGERVDPMVVAAEAQRAAQLGFASPEQAQQVINATQTMGPNGNAADLVTGISYMATDAAQRLANINDVNQLVTVTYPDGTSQQMPLHVAWSQLPTGARIIGPATGGGGAGAGAGGGGFPPGYTGGYPTKGQPTTGGNTATGTGGETPTPVTQTALPAPGTAGAGGPVPSRNAPAAQAAPAAGAAAAPAATTAGGVPVPAPPAAQPAPAAPPVPAPPTPAGVPVPAPAQPAAATPAPAVPRGGAAAAAPPPAPTQTAATYVGPVGVGGAGRSPAQGYPAQLQAGSAAYTNDQAMNRSLGNRIGPLEQALAALRANPSLQTVGHDEVYQFQRVGAAFGLPVGDLTNANAYQVLGKSLANYLMNVPGADRSDLATLGAQAATAHLGQSRPAMEELLAKAVGLERMRTAPVDYFNAQYPDADTAMQNAGHYLATTSNWASKQDPVAYAVDEMTPDMYQSYVKGLSPSALRRFAASRTEAVRLYPWLQPQPEAAPAKPAAAAPVAPAAPAAPGPPRPGTVGPYGGYTSGYSPNPFGGNAGQQ